MSNSQPSWLYQAAKKCGIGLGISTVVTDSAGGDGFAEAFFVFGCEKLAKLDVGLIGGRAKAPHIAR